MLLHNFILTKSIKMAMNVFFWQIQYLFKLALCNELTTVSQVMYMSAPSATSLN